VTRENKQPPLIIPSEYKVSATKIYGGFTIFWIIFYGIIFFNSFNLYNYPISAFQIVASIITGLAFGVILSTVFTRNQLRRLSKDYQFTANVKDLVLLIVPAVLFFSFGGFVSWFLNASLQVWLILIYSWGVSTQLMRVLYFVAFERKENMRLLQSWWGTKTFLVPKAPDNNLNHSGTSAE
jgi:hypothetical protein